MSEPLIYQLALSQIPNIGSVLAKNLVGYCGGVEAVFSEKLSLLKKIPGIGEATAKSVYYFNDFDALQSEITFINDQNISTYFFTDKRYPYRLKQVHNAPIMLFQKGESALNAGRMLAVIGTRKTSQYGKDLTDKLIDELKDYGPSIISGLAYGIDSYAHKAALKYNLPTISVFGHGLDRIYPSQNTNLANKILESSGCWLTEFHTGTIPDRENFPKRNRIVAGMVDGVIVVESPLAGGSMITANMAFGNDREVMAVPGRPWDGHAMGCNNLIKTQRAHLIENGQDVAEILNWDTDIKQTAQIELPISLGPQEQIIFDVLKLHDGLDIDRLTSLTNLNPSILAYKLLEMEMKHLIRNLPGKQYRLI
ncbi:MAG: DNA processing protein [Bacteroidia bacterium]|jgi:DNA processing protein